MTFHKSGSTNFLRFPALACVFGACWMLPLPAGGADIDLASAGFPTVIRVDGAPSSYCSKVSSAGDINGDGYTDIILGASEADNNGRANSGSAYVLFGKPSGFFNMDLASLSAADGFRLDGAAADDRCGTAVSSAGDINADGYADIVVGASSAGNNGRSSSGSAYVLFGKASGWSNIDLASLSAADGFRVDGAAANNNCGSAVSSAGDINGDGYADIVVGASSAGNNGRSYSGSAYVLFGKASGWSNIDLASLSAADGFRVDGAAASDHCGTAVSSAGDVNGDGYCDLLVGATGTNNNGRTSSGSMYVIFGKSSGFANIDLDSFSLSDGWRVDGATEGDRCGFSVASAGDVNADGCADFVVGACFAGHNARFLSGSAYVLFGKASGGSNIDLASLSLDSGFCVDGAGDQDYCGVSVCSAGDLNGDGCSEVVVGAGSADHNGRPFSGSAYVLFGKASGFSNIDTTASLGTNGFRIDGADDDGCGWSVSSAGDYNGDGQADLLVCANRRAGNSGAAYLLFGGVGRSIYRGLTRQGDAPPTAVGTYSFDNAQSGVWLDYDAGDSLSTETVTVYPNVSPLTSITPRSDTNETYWNITTTRTGWSTVQVALRYPRSAEPYQNDLRIYRSDSASGPWTRLDTTINTTRHRVSATINRTEIATHLGWFAIGRSNVLPLGLSTFQLE